MSEEKCEAGCVSYYGGEKRHHKTCVFYPESFTKLYDQSQDTLRTVLDMLNSNASRDNIRRVIEAELGGE